MLLSQVNYAQSKDGHRQVRFYKTVDTSIFGIDCVSSTMGSGKMKKTSKNWIQIYIEYFFPTSTGENEILQFLASNFLCMYAHTFQKRQYTMSMLVFYMITKVFRRTSKNSSSTFPALASLHGQILGSQFLDLPNTDPDELVCTESYFSLVPWPGLIKELEKESFQIICLHKKTYKNEIFLKKVNLFWPGSFTWGCIFP